MFSNAAQYALRAVAYLGTLDGGSYVPARTIAEELAIPPTFLAKVLKQLVDDGILVAFRGPTGGVKLSRPASAITVRDLVEAIDGPGIFTDCILGLPGCGEAKPCPMHAGWAQVRSDLAREFECQTVERLSSEYLSGSLRLKA